MGAAIKRMGTMTDAKGREYVLVPRQEYERLAGAKPPPPGVPAGSVDAIAYARRGLGLKLRATRTTAGLSQAELAERLGVTQGFVSQIEAGSTSPPKGYTERVLEACGGADDAPAPRPSAGKRRRGA